MDAVWIRFRAEFRRRWRAWLALALVVGLVGGLVIAVAAAARRTDTVVTRTLAAARVPDASVSTGGFTGSTIDLADVERLPQVTGAVRTVSFWVWGETDQGLPVARSDQAELFVFAGIDSRYGSEMDRFKLLAGRYANPDRVDEVEIDSLAAERYGLEVGSALKFRFLTPDDMANISETGEWDPGADPDATGSGPLLTFRVVGIRPGLSFEYAAIVLTRAFTDAYGGQVAHITEDTNLRLRHGLDDVAAFRAGVERLGAGQQVLVGGATDFTEELERSIHLQAQALWIVAALAAVAVMLVVGQALARQAALESAEYPSLRALGMVRGQLFVLAMVRALAVGVLGAGLAVGLAVALSPVAPIGLARTVEPAPGIALDLLIVGVGASVVIALVVLAAAIPAWRADRRGDSGLDAAAGRGRGSAAVDLLGRAGLPLTVGAGVRMALERGGGRTAVLGAVVAVAIVSAAASFAASLGHLLDTPRLYGQNFDAFNGTGAGEDLGDAVIPPFRGSPLVEGLTFGTVTSATVGGIASAVLAMDDAKGSVPLATVVEGRAPQGPNEVLLGTNTLEDAAVGDVVKLQVGQATAPMEVVGRGVLPELGGFELGLGKGAVTTFEGLKRLVPDALRNLFLVRVAAGVDPNTALAELPQEYGIYGAATPRGIGDFGRVDSMPYVIAGLFGAMAAAALAHTLVTAVGRRRRELAILKTLGFTRSQVLSAVAWQATALALLGLLVGLPLGIAAGRWAWTLFAEDLGVVPEPVTPLVPILLVIPATILLATLIALLPGRSAARTRPALVLRAE
jgi:ABC-type lipoprotein release transport system permease subunit